MTKEMLIDGVDVSKCPESITICESGNPCIYSCKNNPDCKYKLKIKLQQKQQECEELKQLVENSEFCKFILSECKLKFPIIGHYKQALDKIEALIKQPEMDLQNTILYTVAELDNYISTRRRQKLAQILAIINKAKGEQK